MYFLSDISTSTFARRLGAKDKAPRKRRNTLRNTLLLGAAGGLVLGGAMKAKALLKARKLAKDNEFYDDAIKNISKTSDKIKKTSSNDMGKEIADLTKQVRDLENELGVGSVSGIGKLTKGGKSDLIKRRRGLIQSELGDEFNITVKPNRGYSRITPKDERRRRSQVSKIAASNARKKYGADYSRYLNIIKFING